MPVASTSTRLEHVRLWRDVLGRLELEMNPNNFDTWLRDAELLSVEGDRVVIEARHGVSCDWLELVHGCTVNRAIAAVFGEEFAVRFAPRSFEPAAAAQARGGDSAGTVVAGALNPEFTFERYLAGTGNRVALEACLALLGPDAYRASPVVMYGAPGLGKSHLVHALANRALGMGWPVVCLGAESFTNRYHAALREQHMPEFQASLRSARLFVLDDLEYLSGQSGAAREFGYIIDAVTNAGGVIACAGERSPRELNLPERIVSRLSGGILTRIDALAPEDRRVYINGRIREQRLALPAWATDRIVGCAVPSIRALSGAVNAAVFLERTGQLDPARLDAHLVQLAVQEAAETRSVDQRGLIERVAAHFAVSFDELIGRSRRHPLAEARAVAMAALSDKGQSYTQIAGVFGTRHRSTIIGSAERGRRILAGDPALRARLAG